MLSKEAMESDHDGTLMICDSQTLEGEAGESGIKAILSYIQSLRQDWTICVTLLQKQNKDTHTLKLK